MLWRFANGEDGAPVMPAGYEPPVKSVGHGVTCVRDLEDDYEVWLVIYELAQDLGHRMREYGPGQGSGLAAVADTPPVSHAKPAGNQPDRI